MSNVVAWTLIILIGVPAALVALYVLGLIAGAIVFILGILHAALTAFA